MSVGSLKLSSLFTSYGRFLPCLPIVTFVVFCFLCVVVRLLGYKKSEAIEKGGVAVAISSLLSLILNIPFDSKICLPSP